MAIREVHTTPAWDKFINEKVVIRFKSVVGLGNREYHGVLTIDETPHTIDTTATRYRLISNPNDIVFHKSYVREVREE